MSTASAPRRGRPPRHNRADILEAAAEVLIFRGYETTGYRDVSVATGVPVPSLQHHFPTVGVLRREALKHKVRTELAAVERELSDIDDPWERIAAMVSAAIPADPDRRRGGWVLWLEYWRAAARDPELARDSAEVDAAWLDVTERCIRDGVRRGRFQLDCPPRDAAVEVQALLDGLGTGLAIEHDAATADRCVAVVLRAARRALHVRD